LNNKFKYVEIKPRSREQLEAAFTSHDENEVSNAMYSAAQHEPDWRWTQGKLLEFLNHRSLLLRSTALVALGELALFRRRIDVEVVLPAICKAREEQALVPFVDDCLEDIKTVVTIH